VQFAAGSYAHIGQGGCARPHHRRQDRRSATAQIRRCSCSRRVPFNLTERVSLQQRPLSPRGGRPIDPTSRNQFAEWLEGRYHNISKTFTYKLFDARHQAEVFVHVQITPESEAQLRPLKTWTNPLYGNGERIPEIWEIAGERMRTLSSMNYTSGLRATGRTCSAVLRVSIASKRQSATVPAVVTLAAEALRPPSIDGPRRGDHGMEAHVVVQRAAVQLRVDPAAHEQRPYRGRETQSAGQGSQIQRLMPSRSRASVTTPESRSAIANANIPLNRSTPRGPQL
jgi:hypothetical protein